MAAELVAIIRPMKLKGLLTVGLAAVLAMLVTSTDGLSASKPSQAPLFNLQVTPVGSPAPESGSSLPQMSVSSRGALLSWVERAGATATLKFAERTATGWSPVRTVASGADWFVNWADVPSVVRLANGTLAAHWLQKSGPGTYAYDVKLSYSTNDGRTWATPFSPHNDRTKTEHGFASLFSMPGGGLGLVWLDGRAMAATPGTGAMAGMDHGGGDMTIRFASFDEKWKQTGDALIDARVCECCPTTAVVTSDGVLTAFRNRSDDETRDIFVSRLEQGKWSEPKAAHADEWRIDACPVNGPALGARGRDVVIAWFTGRNSQNHVFVAFSRDAGRTFGNPIALDDEKTLGRVDVAMLSDGSAIATWMESTSSGAQLRARRVDATGQRSSSTTIADMSASRASGYPRMALSGNEVIFAWTENVAGKSGTDGALRVRTAVAPIPKR